MDIMDIAIAKALSGGGGGGTGGGDADLVLTEIAGASDSEYTLKGLSVSELVAKAVTRHEMLRLQYIVLPAVGEDPVFGGDVIVNFHATESEITFSIAYEPVLQIVNGDTIAIQIYEDQYTATYDSTTKEYTLTPYTP